MTNAEAESLVAFINERAMRLPAELLNRSGGAGIRAGIGEGVR